MNRDPAPSDTRPPGQRTVPIAPTPDGAQAPSPRAARITSQQLFGPASEVLIDHHGVLYRLRQTSLGKLILTK